MLVDSILDVVNDEDVVIGQAKRSEIHAKGLWHREVGIWFITPRAEIIFQRRSGAVDYKPHETTVAVGGHVEAGMDYAQAAIIEALEETGLHLDAAELHPLEYKTHSSERIEDYYFNRSHRMVYGYVFRGDVSQLTVEKDYGAGFFAVPLDAILQPDAALVKSLGDYANPTRRAVYEKLRALL